MHDFLTNPVYAGAFVFGRTRTEKRVDPTGRLVVTVRELPRDQWAVLIPDHHPGYLSWEAYQTNQVKLRANWRPPRGHGGGAAREGRALLRRAAALRRVRPDDADRLLRGTRQLPALPVRAGQTALRRRTRLPEHRRAPPRADACCGSCSPCSNRPR